MGNASPRADGNKRWVEPSTAAVDRSEAKIRTGFVVLRARQVRSTIREATKARPQIKDHRNSVSASGESSIYTAAMEKIQVVNMHTTGTGNRIKTLRMPPDNPLKNLISIYHCMGRCIYIGKEKLWFLAKLLLLRQEIITRIGELPDQGFAFQLINGAQLFQGTMLIANSCVN